MCDVCGCGDSHVAARDSAADVVAVRDSVTCAPGMTAPVVSTTRPPMLP